METSKSILHLMILQNACMVHHNHRQWKWIKGENEGHKAIARQQIMTFRISDILIKQSIIPIEQSHSFL